MWLHLHGWIGFHQTKRERVRAQVDEVTGAKLYLTYQGAREVSSVTGRWITRASQEEKSAKCTGPRSRKALKIMLIFGPEPVCGPWRFSLGLCLSTTYGSIQHGNWRKGWLESGVSCKSPCERDKGLKWTVAAKWKCGSRHICRGRCFFFKLNWHFAERKKRFFKTDENVSSLFQIMVKIGNFLPSRKLSWSFLLGKCLFDMDKLILTDCCIFLLPLGAGNEKGN